jgi:hypothetical protein
MTGNFSCWHFLLRKIGDSYIDDQEINFFS